MKITKLYGIEGARSAFGTVVVIDIFRAASLAAYALNKGASFLLPVTTKEEAYAFQSVYPDAVLIGEDEGKYIKNFHYGNSPHEIRHAPLRNKIVIHRSTQGTQGIANAKLAQEIIFGSFPVVSAIVNYLSFQQPSHLSLVALDGPGSEDEIFADYLLTKLQKRQPNFSEIVEKLKSHAHAQRFFDDSRPESPKEDFDLCLSLDIFSFIPKVENVHGQIRIKKYQLK